MTDSSGYVLEKKCVKNREFNIHHDTVCQGSRSMARGGASEITVVATGEKSQRAQNIYFVSCRPNHWATESHDSVLQGFSRQPTRYSHVIQQSNPMV